MSSDYKFLPELYEENITYVNAYSLFAFFMKKEQTDAFFEYLYFRVLKDYEKVKNADGGFIQVLKNDALNISLLDINYNFFVNVLAEWASHYASNKVATAKYKKYRQKEYEDDSGVKKSVGVRREYIIDFSVYERVLFDYSYSGWLISDKFKKSLRYKLVQVLFNNIIGGCTYVRNYKFPKNAMVTNLILVKNTKRRYYAKFVAVSFTIKNLLDILGKTKVKKLLEIADEYEKIISTRKAIDIRIKKLEINDEDIQIFDVFDIKNIEETRDLGDGKYHQFESENSQENDEIEDENSEEDE